MDFAGTGLKKGNGELSAGKVSSVRVKYVIHMKCHSHRKDIKKAFHIW